MGKMGGEFAPNSPRAGATPAPPPPLRPPVAPPQPAPAALGGGDTGGSYRLDPDALQSLIGEWKGLRDDLRNALITARPLVQVTGPGRDPASKKLADLANQSGAAYIQHNREMQNYATDYINKLTDALNAHRTNDQSGAADLNRKQV